MLSLDGAEITTFFGPRGQVHLAGGLGQVVAGAFEHDVHTHLAPAQVVRVALVREFDLLAVDDQAVFGEIHRAIKAAVHAVVLEHVGQVVRRLGVVDADDLDVVEAVFECSAQGQAANAPESVDTQLDGHGESLGIKLLNRYVTGLEIKTLAWA